MTSYQSTGNDGHHGGKEQSNPRRSGPGQESGNCNSGGWSELRVAILRALKGPQMPICPPPIIARGEELINYIICRLVEAAVLFQLRDGALSSIGQQDGEGFGGAVLGSKATLCLPSALPTPF